MQQSFDVHKILSGAGILLLGGLLMVFTSTHTVNFIQLSVPGDNQITAYAALAAFDGGLVIWLYALLFNSVSPGQKSISGVMVFVATIGMLSAYAADTFLIAGKKGVAARVDAGTIDVVLWVTVIVVGLNVLAAVLYHMVDPKAKQRSNLARAEHELQVQEAEVKIRLKQAELRHIAANSELIGEEVARLKARDFVERTRRQAEESIADMPESRRAPVVEPESVRRLPAADQRRNVTLKRDNKKRAVAPVVTAKGGSGFFKVDGLKSNPNPGRGPQTFEGGGPKTFLSGKSSRTIKVQGKPVPALKSKQYDRRKE